MDFRVACGFQYHPKVKQLRRRLGDAAAFSLVCLWGFVAEQGRDGTIRTDAEFIATAAEWGGDPETFVKALIDCELLDRKGRSLQVHNWARRNPYAASFETRSAQARKAIRIRWERVHQERIRTVSEPNNGSNTVPSEAIFGSLTPSPSPIPIPLPDPKRVRSKRPDNTEPAEFVSFYSTYPRHQARKKALEAWRKLNPSTELQARILADIKGRVQADWLGTESKFIPLPASYLNGRRWEDEIDAPNRNNGAVPPTSDEYYGRQS